VVRPRVQHLPASAVLLQTLPKELSEAARIDGCSEFGIFWRIILPLARPPLAVVALFAFLSAWNDFLGPLVYLQVPEQYTLALGLQAFQSQHGGTEVAPVDGGVGVGVPCRCSCCSS
jgi:ABC-type glycerol-3-phosphate transport system permease component